MKKHNHKGSVLMFQCAPQQEFERYFSAITAFSATGVIDVLVPETSSPTSGAYLTKANLKANLISITGSWDDIDSDIVKNLGIESKRYDILAIPYSGDSAIPFGQVIDIAANLMPRRIVLVFNDLSREVIEVPPNGDDPLRLHSEIKLRLLRSLQYGSTEVRTSYVCIHPYYGYVCRPNSVVDFGIQVPSKFGHGSIIEIDRNGFRNSNLPSVKPEDEYWIGLFGGSTAFSIASSYNSTTIAGYLERSVQKLFPGRRIRVINFALPGGQQPQQLIIFANHQEILDGIVTFDGFNEIIVPLLSSGKIPEHFPFFDYYPTLYGRPNQEKQIALGWLISFVEEKSESLPTFLNRISKYLVSGLKQMTKSRLNRMAAEAGESFFSVFCEESDRSFELVQERGARRWTDCILMMRDIAYARNIETLFILQPIPDFGKPLTKSELRIMENCKGTPEQRVGGFNYLWRCLEILRQAGVNCLDFTRIFEDIREDIYVDDLHFEDLGCKIAAEAMAKYITQSWRSISQCKV